MADYESVLRKALRSSNPLGEEERQKTYHRAIAAVVKQLDTIPDMPKEMRERQIRLLEQAIGRVEAQLTVSGFKVDDLKVGGDFHDEILAQGSRLGAGATRREDPPLLLRTRSNILTKFSLAAIPFLGVVFGVQLARTLTSLSYSWDQFFSVFGVGVGFIGLGAVFVAKGITWRRNHD